MFLRAKACRHRSIKGNRFAFVLQSIRVAPATARQVEPLAEIDPRLVRGEERIDASNRRQRLPFLAVVIQGGGHPIAKIDACVKEVRI